MTNDEWVTDAVAERHPKLASHTVAGTKPIRSRPERTMETAEDMPRESLRQGLELLRTATLGPERASQRRSFATSQSQSDTGN